MSSPPYLIALSLAFACTPASSKLEEDGDKDGYTALDGDCDDVDPNTNPGATEICDDKDNDCDGDTDEDDASLDRGTLSTWYADVDGDGYGDPASKTLACFGGLETVDQGDDCDDTDAQVNPDGDEICDEVDNDCDGRVDGDDDSVDMSTVRTWFIDSDGDGYGTSASETEACNEPEGYTDNTDDCDDGDSATYPGATEQCDGKDNDCNGLDDADNPGTAGQETDNDSDGMSECAGDCNDADPSVYTSADEICDGKDNDCNGMEDAGNPGVDGQERDDDGDGLSECAGDCDDDDADIRPDAVEYCDGYDNDCDGAVDLADSDAADRTWYRDDDDDGYGDESASIGSCESPDGYVADSSDCDDSDPSEFPGAVWHHDGDMDGYGDPDDAMTRCARPGSSSIGVYLVDGTDCDDTDGTRYPGAEWYPDVDGDGFGDSSALPDDCEPSETWYVADDEDCDDSDEDIHPGAEEVRADGIDQDCDGEDVTWQNLSAGEDYACGVDSAGGAGCWGRYSSSYMETTVPDLDFTLIEAGISHTCGIETDGTVACWGYDAYDQCYPLAGTFTALALGNIWTCGIRTSGTIACWGSTGGSYEDEIEDEIPTGSYTQIDGYRYQVCALTSSGLLRCWGCADDDCGSWGNEIVDDAPSGRYDKVSVSDSHACALDTDGYITCWGNGYDEVTETPDSSFGEFIDVAAGESVSCAIDDENQIHCWGDSTLETEPAGDYASLYLSKDYYAAACAFDLDNDLTCWGHSYSDMVDCADGEC